MDLDKILAELHERLRDLDTAIMKLEALQNRRAEQPPNMPKRRGRPRKHPPKPHE